MKTRTGVSTRVIPKGLRNAAGQAGVGVLIIITPVIAGSSLIRQPGSIRRAATADSAIGQC